MLNCLIWAGYYSGLELKLAFNFLLNWTFTNVVIYHVPWPRHCCRQSCFTTSFLYFKDLQWSARNVSLLVVFLYRKTCWTLLPSKYKHNLHLVWSKKLPVEIATRPINRYRFKARNTAKFRPNMRRQMFVQKDTLFFVKSRCKSFRFSLQKIGVSWHVYLSFKKMAELLW